jgi:hypothetical protein
MFKVSILLAGIVYVWMYCALAQYSNWMCVSKEKIHLCKLVHFSVSRFYTRKDGVAVARMVDAEFEYTYEYQGNAPKLVHTPLTDKCYLTLTQVSTSLILHVYPI